MVRPTIDAFDDGVSRAFQLIVETALDQPSDDLDGGLFAMKREAADVGFATGAAYRLMHGPDDVAPDAQIAQRRLEIEL